MDDGKREFTSLTLNEEDLFETGESTDGEGEDLDELIFKAENSQHLWLGSDSDEHLYDVGRLQDKLRQKDEGLHLTAKIGKKLLINTNRLANQNQELRTQVLELKEELSQLKYLQSSKGKSIQYFEGSDEEDEGTCCRNNSLSPHSNASNNSHVSLSTSLEETFSLRKQIDQLQLNNLSLRDELKALQHEALDEMDQLKEHYNQEFFNTKKMIGNLERKIDLGENRFSKFEYETKIWKESVEALASKCNLHECEIDELQNEISNIKLNQKEEKNAMQQLVRENEELKDLVSDLKGRVHHMEQNNQPKVLRHVTDSSSPYVDSKSFTQELEQEHLDSSKENRLVRVSPNPAALPHFINHLVYQPESFFSRIRELFRRNVTLKLGQPGRPGSGDLELAVSGLSLVDPFLTFRDPLSSKSHISWFGWQMQLLEELVGAEKRYSKIKTCCDNDHQNEVRGPRNNEIVLTGASSSSNSCTGKALALQHSKFLKNWGNLGTPDITTIFRKESGVWIKGATISEVFIEENFATMGLEAEEDDLVQSPRVISVTNSTDAMRSVASKEVLPKSKVHYKVKTYISTHKSLEDIAKCTYEGVPFKSISLNDMSQRLHHITHKSSLGLDCLLKSTGSHDHGAIEFNAIECDELFSSLKIVRSSKSN